MWVRRSLFLVSLLGFLSTFCYSVEAASNASNSTNICEERQKNTSKEEPLYGYLGAVVAILMFGSNFVPVKKISTGDGVFFQWVLCLGIWFVGLIIHLCHHDRKFYPLVMVGGAIWCTGNICVVPIIKTIGLAMGLLIWCLLNLLSGWATGRFGTFGLICKQHVGKSALNYIGVLFAVISLLFYVFIKTEDVSRDIVRDTVVNERSGNFDANVRPEDNELNQDESSHLLSTLNQDEDSSWLDKLSPGQKRFTGILLSVVSGILYGVSFTPIYIVQKNDAEAPNDGMQYVFSQFCGILMTSTIFFLIYCIYKKNKPDVFPSAVAPGFLSGILWAIGDVGWFIANTKLSEPISFPIVTTGPGIIASIWGVIVFKEIKGMRNFIILGVAFCFQISGAVITGYSK